MTLEAIVRGEVRQPAPEEQIAQDCAYVRPPGVVTFLDRAQGERKMGHYQFMGTEFPFGAMTKVLETADDDGYTSP